MDFEFTIDLNGTPQEVWDFFNDPAATYKWQPTLNNMEIIEGEPGEVGSVARLTYSQGRRTTQLLEVIVDKREPEFISSTFTDVSGSITNHIENYFETFFENTTWRMVVHFEFSSFLMRLITPFLKGSMKKRTLADMERFKIAFEEDLLEKKQAEEEAETHVDDNSMDNKKTLKKQKSKKKKSKKKKSKKSKRKTS